MPSKSEAHPTCGVLDVGGTVFEARSSEAQLRTDLQNGKCSLRADSEALLVEMEGSQAPPRGQSSLPCITSEATETGS